MADKNGAGQVGKPAHCKCLRQSRLNKLQASRTYLLRLIDPLSGAIEALAALFGPEGKDQNEREDHAQFE